MGTKNSESRTSNSIVLKKIQAAYKENRLIPFVGSGFSSSVAPKWDKFITDLFINDTRPLQHITDNLERLEYYVIKNTKKKLIEHINNKLSFKVIEKQNGKPSKVTTEDGEIYLETHDLLCEKFKDRIIYTTNWDNLIEKVGSFDPIINREDILHGCKKGVIKFHGSVGNPKNHGDELIACKSDYWQRISNITPFDILFQSDYIKNYYLFIGYSLRDINISLTIYQLMKLINSNRKKVSEKRIFWAVAEPRSDQRIMVLSKHSNIIPYYLLSAEDSKRLKKIDDSLLKLCGDCRIEDLAKDTEVNTFSGRNVCNACEKKSKIEKLYYNTWNALIIQRTIELFEKLN